MLEVGNAAVKRAAQQCTSCSRHLFSVEKGGRNSDSDYIEFSSDDDDHYDSDKDPSWCPGEGVSNEILDIMCTISLLEKIVTVHT